MFTVIIIIIVITLFLAGGLEFGVTHGHHSLWETNLTFGVKHFYFTFENNLLMPDNAQTCL